MHRFKDEIFRAGARWSEVRATRSAASISFYAILSLAPLLVLVTAVAAEIFGFGPARANLLVNLEAMLGEPARKLIEGMMDHSFKTHDSQFAALFALLLALWGSNGLFTQIRESVDDIWAMRHEYGGIVRSFLMSKVISAITALTFLSLMVGWIAWDAFRWQSEFARGAIRTFPWLSALWNMGFIYFALAVLYRSLPLPKIKLNDVLFGATIGAIGLTLLKTLLGLYLQYSSLGATYGSIGAIFAILLWCYYSSQVFLFGAALVWARTQQPEAKSIESPLS